MRIMIRIKRRQWIAVAVAVAVAALAAPAAQAGPTEGTSANAVLASPTRPTGLDEGTGAIASVGPVAQVAPTPVPSNATPSRIEDSGGFSWLAPAIGAGAALALVAVLSLGASRRALRRLASG